MTRGYARADGAGGHEPATGDQTPRCRYEWAAAEQQASCCYREVWGSSDRCIWHAEVDEAIEKPVDELDAVRETESNRREFNNPPGGGLPELLDGARLTGVAFVDDFSLDYCSLRVAFFDHARLSGVTFWGADLSEAGFRFADLSDADLWQADLSGADLMWADLSGADLRYTNLSGAVFQETSFEGVQMNQDSRIGYPSSVYYPAELDQATQEQLETILFAEEHAEASDSLARAYHSLGEAAKANGLIGKARSLRIRERKARRTEAFERRDWQAFVGSLLSDYLTGYGVSVRRISSAIVFTILASAFVYWWTTIPGVETPQQALDYSLLTFTGIGSPLGPPTTQPSRSIAILEAFAGILFSVLLGYVLGNRESP